MYIDTHVHLNDETLYNKLDEVLSDARENKVDHFIVVGYDLESSKRAIELTKVIPNCYCAIGFHPTEIGGYGDEEYKWLDEHASDDKVVAIGEIGYDFHWDKTTAEEQKEAFVKQIEIAKKHNLPIIIHSRDALEKTYLTLKETDASKIGGVMHSYSGSYEYAKNFLDLNFYLGISGPVTFKNGQKMKEVVKEIDINYLLSETDSPYLTPSPYRGTENGPKYIPLIVEKIAEIKVMPVSDVVGILMNNAKKLFKLGEDDENK